MNFDRQFEHGRYKRLEHCRRPDTKRDIASNIGQCYTYYRSSDLLVIWLVSLPGANVPEIVLSNGSLGGQLPPVAFLQALRQINLAVVLRLVQDTLLQQILPLTSGNSEHQAGAQTYGEHQVKR